MPLPYRSKQDLFVAGVILPSAALREAIRELAGAATTQTWLLDSNHYEWITWIELIAFSDRPLAVMESLDLLPTHLRLPHQLGPLFHALGWSPHPDAVATLKALADRDPNALGQYEWLEAMIRRRTADAARILLDYLCHGELLNRSRNTGRGVSRLLCDIARADPAFRAELYTRHADVMNADVRSVLELVLLELQAPEAVLFVVRRRSARGQGWDFRLSKGIRNLSVGKRPSTRWTNAVEHFSVGLADFRRQLLAMTVEATTSLLAIRCLEEIDTLRDEHGRVNDEPRHPDLASGTPWPLVFARTYAALAAFPDLDRLPPAAVLAPEGVLHAGIDPTTPLWSSRR